MGWGNPNPFHWWNPGSWLGREDHLPPPQPAFDPNALDGVPRTGPVFGPQTPRADITMDPTKRGFLATLAGPESGGAYDIRNGGARFSDYSHFPEGIGAAAPARRRALTSSRPRPGGRKRRGLACAT